MKYIIYLGYGAEYYSGKDYIFQGQKFAAEACKVTAKRYKSRKVALNVAARLRDTTANCCCGLVRVKEVDE